MKYDEDGNALGGALIGIFKTGETEFTKETAIATTTSADDGSFSFTVNSRSGKIKRATSSS